jgi:hypothetical protein
MSRPVALPPDIEQLLAPLTPEREVQLLNRAQLVPDLVEVEAGYFRQHRHTPEAVAVIPRLYLIARDHQPTPAQSTIARRALCTQHAVSEVIDRLDGQGMGCLVTRATKFNPQSGKSTIRRIEGLRYSVDVPRHETRRRMAQLLDLAERVGIAFDKAASLVRQGREAWRVLFLLVRNAHNASFSDAAATVRDGLRSVAAVLAGAKKFEGPTIYGALGSSLPTGREEPRSSGANALAGPLWSRIRFLCDLVGDDNWVRTGRAIAKRAKAAGIPFTRAVEIFARRAHEARSEAAPRGSVRQPAAWTFARWREDLVA